MHDPAPPSLPDPALTAILSEWAHPVYDPPSTDLPQWIHSFHSLCDTYSIPDTRRAQCAIKFIKPPLRNELEKVLADAQSAFGPIHWAQFKIFLTAFDRDFRQKWNDLPFYTKHPQATGVALGVAGGILLAPVAVVGVLSAVGFTSAGVAAGSIAATIQSIVYGGATGGLFSLLQSAGATMVLPSIGAIFTGAATTAAGVAVMSTKPATPDSLLSNSNPAALLDETHLLTPHAIQAIINSWSITPYNPPSTDASRWLSRIHNRCDTYGIPTTQRALCAMHHMRADCRDAAHAAACHEMPWDQFKTWLLHYDLTSGNNPIC